MSFVGELERAIKAAEQHAGESLVAHVTNPNDDYVPVPLVIPNLLTTHGPRLLAAVRREQAAREHMRDIEFIAQGGNTATSAAALCETYERAAQRFLTAYRTACAGDSETGRLNKEKP